MDHLVSGRRIAVLSMLSVSMIPFLNNPAFAAGALPSGGNFVAGTGKIAGTASQLTVNQTTQRGIINWSGFSIGRGNSVKIDNGSSATLNRVTGNSPSAIAGSLTSTGSTYVINQNGVVVTPTGQVLTGGSFVASTRDTSNSAFMAGQEPEFTGTSAGAVTNQGSIKASNGDVVLIGKSASNSGSISAPNGTAGVVAGDDVLLQPSGSGLQIDVKAGIGDAANSGNIAAVQAVINAVGGNAYALAGNNGGIVRATGTKTVNGHVWLTASGTAQVTGTVAAQNADGSGGGIDVQGTNINVSGTLNATAVAAKADGGTITVGSKNVASTTVSGTLEARGGSSGGDGGRIETSGEVLNIGGATVNASAPHGKAGSWSLDPYDLTVDATAASSINTTLGSNTNVSLQTTGSGTSGPGTPNPAGNGDIFINSVLSWNTPAMLAISAYRNIDVNANITVAGGGTLSLSTGGGGSSDYIIANGASIQFTGGSAAGAGLIIDSTPYALIYDMAGLQNINSGLNGNYALAIPLDATGVSNWIPLGTHDPNSTGANVTNSGNGFAGVFAGLGNTISNLTINLPSAQLVGLFGYSTGVIRDIGVVGGSIAGASQTGTLVGSNHGSVTESYSTGTLTGYSVLGGLVGGNTGSVTRSWSASVVAASGNSVGGLVGYNGATITQSYSTGAVTGTNDLGGFVGANNGTITQSYSMGYVTGGDVTSGVGGLVGYNSGTISQAYSTGRVNAPSPAGWLCCYVASPLVGVNSGSASVTSSYVDGNISGLMPSYGGTTSAQLEAALPAGFDPAVWGNANNRTLPYLKSNLGPVYVAGDDTHLYNLIFSLAQLEAMPLTGNYALAAPLDATGVSNWVPIGTDGAGNVLNSGKGFAGLFDGLGNAGSTISNLTINSRSTNYVGLFGYSSGTISDLRVIGGSVTGGNNVGGVVGANAGTITRSYSTATVSGASFVGGLAGRNDGSIDNVYATGTVSGSAQYVGGLTGYDTGAISNAYATGAVNGNQYAGGLIGYVSSGAISSSWSAGAVSGAANVGGFAGYDSSGTYTNDYWNTDTSGRVTTSGTATGLTTAQLTAALPAGFDPTIWGNSNNQTTPYLLFHPGPAYIGSDSTDIYNLVSSMAELQVINASSASLQEKYALANSVDATGVSNWTPIGTDGASNVLNSGNGFSGTFDGLGNAILNLAINLPSANHVGLFGFSSGTIRNLGTLGGSVTGGANTGGLVGTNKGTISNSYAATVVSGTQNVGGLVGSNSGAISNSYSTGAVSGNDSVGGLTGFNGGAISSSYSTGQISGSTNVGGFVGTDASGTYSNDHWDTDTSGQLTTAGSATGLTTAALQGSLSTLGFDPAVWGNANSQTTPYLLSNPGPVYIVGDHTNLYIAVLSMAGLETINTSDFSLQQNYALATSLDATGVTIWIPLGTTNQLIPAMSSPGIDQVLNSDNGFSGIFDGLGNTISNLTISNGIFDGSHNTFSNLTTSPSIQHAGLFGYSTGTIRDIGLTGFSITGSTIGGSDTGALAGQNWGTIENSYVTASVTGVGTGNGGLVGNNNGMITNSHSSGSVNGALSGGLAGNNGGTITNSFSSATVSGDSVVGGLVGSDGGVISNSHATGAVSGGSNVGGLVGSETGTLSNSYATGGVRGGQSVGGLVGDNAGTISNSFATGTVSGNSYIGGLVGNNDECGYGTISSSYSTGAVSGGQYVGGLVGFDGSAAATTISNSYSTSAVSGNDSVGGLVGYENGVITSSWSAGRVSGISNVGGFIGGFTSSGVADSSNYWNTETSGQSASAGNETGLTTAQLQGSLPGGFDPTVWGTGTGLYPYFLWQYPSGTPQAVSGIAYSDRGVTPLSSAARVSVLINGTSIGSASTGANGYYHVLAAPGTISSGGSQVLAYLSGGAVTGNTLADSATGSISGLSIYGNFLRLTGAGATLSGMAADLNAALGSNSGSSFLFNPGTILSLKSGSSLEIDSTASALNLDQPIDAGGGGVFVNSSGNVTQSAPITAGDLTLSGSDNFTLTNSSNNFATIAATAGVLNLSDAAAGNLTVDAIQASGGALTLAAGGSMSINAGISTSSGALAVTLNSGTAGPVGYVDIEAPITTGGGNILIGGGPNGPSNGAAFGGAAHPVGVTINGTLNAGAGSIHIMGNGNWADTSGMADGVDIRQSLTAGGGIYIGGEASSLGAPSWAIKIASPISASNGSVFLNGSGNGDANLGADSVSVGASVSANGSISVRADTLALNAPLNSSSSYVAIYPTTLNRTISVGGNADPGNDLFISSAALGEITAGSLTIGQFGGTGALTITGNVVSPTLSLTLADSTVNVTGGSITNSVPGGNIDIGADSLVLTQPLSASTYITLQTNTPNRAISAGGSVDPGNDLFVSSALLSEIATKDLNIEGRFAGGGTLAVTGNLASPAQLLRLEDSTVNITGGSVTNTLPGGGINIMADSLALTQPLNAGSFLTLQPFTSNRPVSVGGGTDPGNDLFVSSAMLGEITAGSLTIGQFGGTGALTVVANTASPTPSLTLADSTVNVAGGSVSSTLGSITIAADSVAINQPVSSTQGAINIAADSLTLTQPVSVSDNFDGITIQPFTPSRPINVGGSSDPNAGNDLFVSSAALSQITLGKFGNLNIGTSADTGTLTVVANTASPVSNLNLTDTAVAIAPDAILSNQNGTFVPNSNPPGSLTIQTDNFTIGTGVQIQATNASVSLFALSPSRPINVGGSADPDPGNDLFISAAALSQITVANAPGFGDLSIGAPQGTGTLTVTTNVNSPVEMLTLSDSTVSLAPGAVLSDSGTASDIGGPLTGIGVISDKFSFGSGAQIQAPAGLVAFAPHTNTLAVNAGGSIDPGNDLFLSTAGLNSVSAAQLFIRSVKGPLTVSAPLDGSPGGALEHITDVELSSPNATGLIANPVTLSSSGALQLLSQNASFSQTAPITAGSLILGGPNLGGDYDLTNPANSFVNLAVHRAGTADLVDSAPLNVTGIGVSAIGTAIPAGTTTITDTAAGGITVSGAVNMASGAPLTLYSYGTISVNAPVSLNDAPATLDANIEGNGGYVDIQAPITTNGGNLVIGGGANPAVTAAAGTASHPNGVEVNGALDTATGAITVNGQGFAGASGAAIGIDVAAPISTSGANAITLAGTGGGSGASSQSYGVNVANVISATGSGAISITGTGGDPGGSGASNHGVLVSAGSGVTATSLISGNTGTLSITGSASNSSGGGNYGIYTTAKISNSGPITLSANSMHIGAGIDPPAASVTLQPLTSSLPVNVGGATDPGNGLFLSTAALNEISANALVIGNASDTGPLTVTSALTTASGGALQNVNNLTLNSGSGQIAVNAPITVTGSNPFNLAVDSGTPIVYGATGVISATGTGILSATINGVSAATNFSGANLAGANLNGDNLSGVNLSGSNLSKANLNKANLTNANLLNADLTGANFNNAVWTGATVSDSGTYTPPSLPAGTNWSGLNLSGMNLSGMNLAGYNLSGSNLSGAKLSGANLTGANLSGANLSGAILFGANFTNADLQGANLLGVIIQ